MRMLVILFTLTLLTLSVYADSNQDKILKEQCRYELYKYGKNNAKASEYLTAIINDYKWLKSYIPSNTKSLACLKALDNASSEGFERDYRNQIISLISK